MRVGKNNYRRLERERRKLNGKNILLCDCEGTMNLDAKSLEKLFGGGKVPINTHLCRVQIANFTQALGDGEPVVVACTQAR
jgi:hypothetical protein